MLQKVDFNIALSMEYFIAHRATGDLLEPIINALMVKNMEAAQHAAGVVVGDWAQTYHTITH